jgi:hypothetical protein
VTVTYDDVVTEARQRCPNGCRQLFNGRPQTCGRCQAAADLAWFFVLCVTTADADLQLCACGCGRRVPYGLIAH